MTYILLAALIMMLAIAFVFSKKDIMSPWVISCGVFTLVTIVAVLNQEEWGFSLSPVTVAIILGALLAFGIGELTVSYAFDSLARPSFSRPALINPDRTSASGEKKPIYVPFAIMVILVVFLVAVAIGYTRKMYEISVLGGNPGGYSLMLKYARDYLLIPGNTIGRMYGHLMIFCKMINYVFMFIFIYNFVFFKFRFYNLIYLVPMIVQVVIGIMGTGRTFVIEIFASAIIMFFIMLKKKNKWNNKETMIFVVVALGAVLLFFLLFTILGYLTGKTQLRENPMEFISYYTGMSIPSLDAYITNPPDKADGLFGQETLYGIHSILRTIGFDIPNATRPLEFVNFNGYNGNVYTSLRRYINDYGVGGMLAVQYLIGFVYGLLYKYIRYGRFSNFAVIVYSMLAFPLVMQAIEENLLSVNISTTFVYSMVYLSIVYFLFVYVPQRPVKQKRPIRRRALA